MRSEEEDLLGWSIRSPGTRCGPGEDRPRLRCLRGGIPCGCMKAAGLLNMAKLLTAQQQISLTLG